MRPRRRGGRPHQLKDEPHPPPRCLQAGLRCLHRNQARHAEEDGEIGEHHEVHAQADAGHDDEEQRGVTPHHHGQRTSHHQKEIERRCYAPSGPVCRLRPTDERQEEEGEGDDDVGRRRPRTRPRVAPGGRNRTRLRQVPGRRWRGLHRSRLRSLAASSFSHARTVPPWQRAPEARAGISYPGMNRAIPTIPEADHRLMIARTRASRLIP